MILCPKPGDPDPNDLLTPVTKLIIRTLKKKLKGKK